MSDEEDDNKKCLDYFDFNDYCFDSDSEKKSKKEKDSENDSDSENKNISKGSGSDSDNSSGKDRSSEKEKKEQTESDKRRNEVRVEFTKNFKKKLAKFKPPKINFKGNISKRKLIKQKNNFEGKFTSHLILFKNYIIITVESAIHFYDYNLNLIFNNKFVQGDEEILCLNPINNETIICGTSNRVLVVNFYEKTEKQITLEIIQEIKDTEFYALNEKLNNGYILLGGFDRKYAFYEIININNKLKLQLMHKIEKVHNVYDDDSPDIVDLNNGRLFSWLNDDNNIKIIEYGSKPRIIKSMNGYGLHNAGLLNDKYLLLMGLTYPKYYSWLMDTETLEIVHKWRTPQNDSFMCALSENKFLYGSDKRIACDEFYIDKEKFKRKNIYNSNFNDNMEDIDWKDTFGIRDFLNETTFVTLDFNGTLMIFQCDKD